MSKHSKTFFEKEPDDAFCKKRKQNSFEYLIDIMIKKEKERNNRNNNNNNEAVDNCNGVRRLLIITIIKIV